MITPKVLRRLNLLAALALLLCALIPLEPIQASDSERLVEPLNSSTQDIQDNDATLTVMNGDVYLRKLGEEAWGPVTETTWVRAGDTIKTGENGSAALTFLDGTESVIDPSTEMTVTALQLNPEEPFLVQLRLWAGSAWHRIRGFSVSGSTYKVETPSAVLAARGTAWWVRVDLDGRTWVAILEGHVDIEGEYTLITLEDLNPDGLGPNHVIREYFRRDIPDDTEQLPQEGLGLGVAAQIYFIAQQLETALTADELAELKDKLGVETAITADDLAAALQSGAMKLAEIKKLTGSPSSSDGNLGMIRSGKDKSSDGGAGGGDDNSDKGGDDNSNKGGGNDKDKGGGKGGGKKK